MVSNRISQRLISSLFVPRVRGCAFNRRVANCGSRALDTTYVWREGGAKGRESTDWVAATEAKSETKYFVQVDWVGIEDANVHLPFFEIVCWDKTDAWREILMDLGASFVFLSWWAVRDLGLFVRLFPYFWELLSCRKVLKLALKRDVFFFLGVSAHEIWRLTLPKRFAMNIATGILYSDPTWYSW